MLKSAKGQESKPSQMSRRVADHPLSRHYGALLRSLRRRDEDPSSRTAIGVTSLRRDAGATTVTLNLAFRAASEGISVLLVDLDLVHRDLTRRLRGRRKSPGFLDFLHSQADLDDCILETEDEHLHLLGGGKSTGLVSPEVASHVLGELTDRYEIVLFDLPPSSEAGPWQEFAPFLDATLLVLEADREDRRALLEAKRRLTEIGVEITGAVWNKHLVT